VKYRKKPVVIDAEQWLPDDPEQVGKVLGLFFGADFRDFFIKSDKSLTIKTLEGDHRTDIGDFVLKGVAGEFYPCKPDIFAATYELAE
jgi:hypothetical protein